MAPETCYRCHGDMQVFQQIAGPHQICGPNGFNCTTCHDPHGQILESTRKDLCLQCHSQHAPTMAWHSSIHNLNGVCCTDCHNPHPRACVPQVVDIDHCPGRPAEAAADGGGRTVYLLQVPSQDLRAQRRCLRITRSRKARWFAPTATIRTARTPTTSRRRPSTWCATSATRRSRGRLPSSTRRSARTAPFATIRTGPWPTTC